MQFPYTFPFYFWIRILETIRLDSALNDDAKLASAICQEQGADSEFKQLVEVSGVLDGR